MGSSFVRGSMRDSLHHHPARVRCVSHAGMTKGKQQLKARLEMLLWALTHSNALSPQAARFLRGKGYLYFPKSSSVRWRPPGSACMRAHLSRTAQRIPLG